MATYPLLNLVAISIPLILSFDKKVHYYKRWKYLFPAIGINLTIFIIWDIIFTYNGVWGFNPIHLSGIEIVNLPLGEWLFFITVPYSCVFLYDVFKAYIAKDPFRRVSRPISFFLMGFTLVLGFLHYDKIYTFITFFLLALLIAFLELVWKAKFMGWFYFAYMIILIPFLIMNGILTGSFIEEEIVWYNNNENLNFRIFTIPVEDFFYGMLLILSNVSIYEYLQNRKSRSQAP
ncbi:MAG: lycopene cyclase domain-containing protein [Bacteroidota bacterium]